MGQHSVEIGARALRVAPAEQDRIARRDLRPKHDPALPRVDPHQIADEIIAGVRTLHRQPGEDDPAEAARVAGEIGADIVEEDGEGRPAVDRHHDIVARLVDAPYRPDRDAALGQRGRDRHLRGQQQPRDAGLAESVRPLAGQQRRLAAVRDEAADQEGAARGAGVDRRRDQIGTARIGMHPGEAGLRLLDPAGVLARQIGGGVVGRGEQPKAVGWQRRDHHRGGRVVIDLVPAGKDAEPDAADPRGDAGAGGQIADQLRQHRRGRLADIEDAERRVFLGARELRQTVPSEGGHVANGQGGGKGRTHQEPPISRAT